MARSCPNPWGPPRRFPAGANPEDDAPENVNDTPSEQSGANVNDNPVPITAEQPVVINSVPDGNSLNVANPVLNESPSSVVTPAVANESSNSGLNSNLDENASQEIGEFSSSQSPLDSQSISDFSE